MDRLPGRLNRDEGMETQDIELPSPTSEVSLESNKRLFDYETFLNDTTANKGYSVVDIFRSESSVTERIQEEMRNSEAIVLNIRPISDAVSAILVDKKYTINIDLKTDFGIEDFVMDYIRPKILVSTRTRGTNGAEGIFFFRSALFQSNDEKETSQSVEMQRSLVDPIVDYITDGETKYIHTNLELEIAHENYPPKRRILTIEFEQDPEDDAKNPQVQIDYLHVHVQL